MNTVTTALIVYPDGREVCRDTVAGRLEYHERRHIAWVLQEGRCAICGRIIAFRNAVTDHVAPRGMNGGRRDDRQANLQATCWECNSEKGSRRE